MPHLMLYFRDRNTQTKDRIMRTTINLDDDLLAQAARVSGLSERTLLIHEGLKALIERESARRLARLSGTQKALKVPPRRRALA